MNWDSETLEAFKRAYVLRCKDCGCVPKAEHCARIFRFRGHDYFPPYARYLIEFLENQGL